ncbi:hypothetical protein GCM10027570_14880 [Streptomonospora sediminis]
MPPIVTAVRAAAVQATTGAAGCAAPPEHLCGGFNGTINGTLTGARPCGSGTAGRVEGPLPQGR